MQRGPDCLSGSQTTAGLVSLDAFARSKDATPSPPRSSHFHPWWCTPPVLLGCLGALRSSIGYGAKWLDFSLVGPHPPVRNSTPAHEPELGRSQRPFGVTGRLNDHRRDRERQPHDP